MFWACTTCGACNEVCPVGIEIVHKIVDGRRGRVEGGTVPAAAVDVFEHTAGHFNPYGKAASDRLAWASGLDIPVAQNDEPIALLYWVGCAGAFDPDGQAVSRAMIKILNHLGIHYRLLGRRECCTGDPARRLGEEGLFQQLARQNIACLKQHAVTRVLTPCPHCFNTFKNEYPTLGAEFTVEHHSQFLARMIRAGRLQLPRSDAAPSPFTIRAIWAEAMARRWPRGRCLQPCHHSSYWRCPAVAHTPSVVAPGAAPCGWTCQDTCALRPCVPKRRLRLAPVPLLRRVPFARPCSRLRSRV